MTVTTIEEKRHVLLHVVRDDSQAEIPFAGQRAAVEHFRIGNQLVETRLFMRHPDGVWASYTFQWNGAQTEATRVTGGATANVGGQTWIFPSEAQCMQCHTDAAGFSLGLETAQQNGTTSVNLDLRHDTALNQTGACDIAPSGGDLGIVNARIIAPGDDTRSMLLARMARRNDPDMMPPIASNLRDSAGEALIGAWIDSLTPASCQ